MSSIINVCRSCMSDIDEGYPLFDIYEDDLTLASILEKSLKQNIDEGDGLPNMLCHTCTDKVVTFFNFIQTYEASQKHFLEMKAVLTATDEVVIRIDETRSFTCDICGKTFARKNTLSNHLDTHSSERKYQCKICNRCFKSRPSLGRHTKKHKSKDFPMCEQCGRVFSDKCGLTTHTYLVHSGEKPLKCLICDKAFALKAHLKRHIVRHERKDVTNEMKFKCSECDKIYLNDCSLKRHVDIKHRNVIVGNCDHCRKAFYTVSSLLSHMKTVHI